MYANSHKSYLFSYSNQLSSNNVHLREKLAITFTSISAYESVLLLGLQVLLIGSVGYCHRTASDRVPWTTLES